MRKNISIPLIFQSRKILYNYKSKLLLPAKSPLFAYKFICIVQPGRPGCNNTIPFLLMTIENILSKYHISTL